MRAKHDIIGSNYAALRKPDQRIARIIDSAPGQRRCAQLLTLDEYDVGYRLVVAD